MAESVADIDLFTYTSSDSMPTLHNYLPHADALGSEGAVIVLEPLKFCGLLI